MEFLNKTREFEHEYLALDHEPLECGYEKKGRFVSKTLSEADLNIAPKCSGALTSANRDVLELSEQYTSTLKNYLKLKRFARSEYLFHVKALFLNLLKAMLIGDGWLALTRDRNHYSGVYAEGMSHQILIKNVVDPLMCLGLIEQANGCNHTDLHRYSRIRAVKKLGDDLASLDIGLLEISEDPGSKQSIHLKQEKEWNYSIKRRKSYSRSKLIGYTENDATACSRAHLLRINKAIQERWIDLYVTNQEFIEISEVLSRKDRESDRTRIDLVSTLLYRVFNNGSFDEGGRFYGGWWQAIPKEWRPFITIDGQLTVEYDYSALHPELIYSSSNAKRPQGDLYQIDGYERKDVKLAFQILLNARNEEKCLNRVSIDLGLEADAAEKLLEAIKIKHSGIACYFNRGIGTRLQKKDSEIAEAIMLRALDEIDSIVLPIHDSFLIQSEYGEWLRHTMEETIVDHTGSLATIKREFNPRYDPSQVVDGVANRIVRGNYYRREQEWALKLVSRE